MKKGLSAWLFFVAASLFFFTQCKSDGSASGAAPRQQIFVSKGVLMTAEWAGYDYKGKLAMARTGDKAAIWDFLMFFGTLDGHDKTDHALTVAELGMEVSDATLAEVVSKTNERLRAELKREIPRGMVKSQRPDFYGKHPQQLFPLTWEVITGTPNKALQTARDSLKIDSKTYLDTLKVQKPEVNAIKK